jgi:hypothetical protein
LHPDYPVCPLLAELPYCIAILKEFPILNFIMVVFKREYFMYADKTATMRIHLFASF